MNASAFVIETNNLTHRFSAQESALDDLCLQVPENSIYGFLGPNGAGKTTTIRLLLGLLKKQEGSVSIFGKPFDENRIEILQKTGTLVEAPSIYAHLTASENLELLRRLYSSPKSRIDEVLDLVGLSATGKKKAGQFSLGMKQRLSIAIALLHEPQLLILDEPTNGLDPNGIIEMRELLKKLNRESGMTMLISSHLLPEIEKLATHVGILHKGRLLFQGSLPDLMLRQQMASLTVMDTTDNPLALKMLMAENIPACFENGKIVLQVSEKEKLAGINRQLVAQQIGVFEISAIKNDLESIFINLTK